MDVHGAACGEALSQEGERCSLTVRNETSHDVEVYADGRPIAHVGPRGTVHVALWRGDTWLHARAVCHNLAWGPARYSLGAALVWPLTPP